MSNYTHLQRNTLDGLSETGGIFYLKLLDVFEAHTSRANERRAFLAAAKYDEGSGGVLDYIIENSPAHSLTRDVKLSLKRFLSERYRHNFMQEQSA